MPEVAEGKGCDLLSKGHIFKKGQKQKWKGSYLLIILFKIKHKQWSNLLL
jgi:hypothetical protein